MTTGTNDVTFDLSPELTSLIIGLNNKDGFDHEFYIKCTDGSGSIGRWGDTTGKKITLKQEPKCKGATDYFGSSTPPTDAS